MSSTKFVFFGPIGKIRWLPCPLIGWDIFDFSSKTTEWNSMKLDRKLDHNVLYQVCVFGPIEKNKMAAMASDWLTHFRLLHWNCWTELNETWQEARSQHPLPSLCFSSWSEKTRWSPWPLIGWDIFDFSSETIEWNSTKLYRKQEISTSSTKFGFSGRLKKQDGCLGLWLAETFSTSLKPLNGIQRNLTESKISTSSTKFVFFGSISIQKLQPWLLCQKGCTLYSGARYVALWASCFHRQFYINIIGCLKLCRDEHSFSEILNNYWVFKCTHLLMHWPEMGYSWSFWFTVILYYPIDSGL